MRLEEGGGEFSTGGTKDKAEKIEVGQHTAAHPEKTEQLLRKSEVSLIILSHKLVVYVFVFL